MDKEIVAVVEQLRKEIFDNYVSKGLVASGDFGRNLTLHEKGDSIKLTSPKHVIQMEKGRKAGSFPPVSAIRQWIKDKNRTAGTDIPEEAAYAIAYVIKRDGIKVPNRYNGGGVVSDIINPERVKRLTLDINRIIKAKILTILTR